MLTYTLAEMLGRRKSDGTFYTVPDVFAGPALDCGFIEDSELEAAELRTEVRLSDVISLIMDIDGVRAVRELAINPVDLETQPHTRWVVPVAAGMQPVLDAASSRLFLYKRDVPVTPSRRFERLPPAAERHFDAETPIGRRAISLGRTAAGATTRSKSFPSIYGVGRRRAAVRAEARVASGAARPSALRPTLSSIM